MPPDPTTVTATETQLTTLQNVLGDRVIGFEGYIRKPKYRLKVNADSIFMDKNGKHTIVVPAEHLRKRIPDFLELAEYNSLTTSLLSDQTNGVATSAVSNRLLRYRVTE